LKLNLSTCQVSESCSQLVPPGMVVCSDHANTLAWTLLTVRSLGRALEDARAKSMRFSTAGVTPTRPDESPIPYNPRAADAERELLIRLTEAADLIAREGGWHRPLNTLDVLGFWLARQVSWIRAHHDGAEMVRHLLHVVWDATRVVDRPADRVYLGSCDQVVDGYRCAAELYALPDAIEWTCPSCAWTLDVATRRADLMGIAGQTLLPATDVARVISSLGMDITAARVREWASRRPALLRPVEGPRPRGVQQRFPVYRVADALAILDGIEARRVARRQGWDERAVTAP
jgi:hypothetical protein